MSGKSAKIGLVFLAVVCLGISANADEILFGLRPMPPYVMISADGTLSGIEYDIIASALAVKGHTMKVQLFPLARVISSIAARDVQGAATILPAHNTGAYLSDVYAIFNNVVLALRESNLKIRSLADLKGHSIVAFQLATKALGSEFSDAVSGNPNYVEQANQVTQILLLFSRRVELVVGDRLILHYYIRNPGTSVDTSLPTVEYAVFPPTEYRAAFTNPNHMADFNEGLAVIRKNGTYKEILAKYTK